MVEIKNKEDKDDEKEDETKCCLLFPMRCGLCTLALYGVLNLWSIHNAYQVGTQLLMPINGLTGVSFLTIVGIAYIPEIIYYVYLLRWICGNDTKESRGGLVKGFNCLLFTMLFLLVAWPIFFTLALGMEGFEQCLYLSTG